MLGRTSVYCPANSWPTEREKNSGDATFKLRPKSIKVLGLKRSITVKYRSQTMPTYPHFRNHQLTLKLDTDPSGQDRMEIEDAILRKLGNHPHIVTYRGRDDSTGALILDTARSVLLA